MYYLLGFIIQLCIESLCNEILLCPDSVMYTPIDILDKLIWGVIIGIRAGRFISDLAADH